MLKEFMCDSLCVKLFATRQEMGSCAGREAAACLKRLLQEKETINVMFAAAPSQNETLAALLRDAEIDWSRVNGFHMDEYVGLDPAHPAGFRNFLNRSIFGLRNFHSVNLIDGSASSPEAEAKRYDQLLRDHPLDVCLLGVGENGHIAFNDPPVADFSDPCYVKVVELEERCRRQQVNDGCFSAIDLVPRYALTVTIPGLIQASEMFCSVPAATKAGAVFHMLRDEISTKCPASVLRTHPGARLYVDADAGKYIL